MIYLAYIQEGNQFVRYGRQYKRIESAKKLVKRSGKLGYVEQYPNRHPVWTNLEEIVI